MKRLFKLLSVFMVLAILMSLVTACSGSNKTQSSGSQSQQSGKKEPVNLVVWGGVPPENGPQELVDKWNKTHPDIQVTYVRFVNDDTGNTKLDTALLSGEQIDAYFSYDVPKMTKRIESGMAEDLSGFGANKYVKENIGNEGVFKYKGKFYSIPTVREPVYFMINKGLLDKAGIQVPKEWTVDEFRSIAKKLTVTENGKVRYGSFNAPDLVSMTLGGNGWYKNNGTESNFDNPIFKQNAQLYYDMMYTDKSTFPYSEVLSRKLQVYSQDLFLNQEVAMMGSSPWMLRYVKDTSKYPHDWITTFAPLPVPEKGKEYFNGGGGLNNWILMNSKSQHKKETWEFMKYWITEGATNYISKSGKVPAWKNADQNKIVENILGTDANKLFDVEAFKRIALDPKLKFSIQTITTAAPEIQQILKEEGDKLNLKEQTVDQYIQNVKKRADDAIKNAAK